MSLIPRNSLLDATVAHEGNPRMASLTVTGTLDGEVFIEIVPLISPGGNVPPETPNNPPPVTDCPDCVGIITSDADTVTQALCASDTGDGCVVSCPGDYSGDPAFYDAACANYYGAWSFGLNATRYFSTTAPVWYTTVPSLWQPPKGFISLNSSCAARVTKQLTFDWRATQTAIPHVDYTAITPATFQSDVIDNYDSTGAQGALSCGTVSIDGTDLADATCLGYLDCRRGGGVSSDSCPGYYSQVQAFYESELHNPATGVAMLTDNGANPKITGYGIIVNRFNGNVEVVQWADANVNGYSVLSSTPYTPAQGDQFTLRMIMRCQCPLGSTSGTTVRPAYPKSGYVYAFMFPVGAGSAVELYVGSHGTPPADLDGQIGPEIFQSLGYGALVGVQVNNGRCDNIAVWRDVSVAFGQITNSCSSNT